LPTSWGCVARKSSYSLSNRFPEADQTQSEWSRAALAFRALPLHKTLELILVGDPHIEMALLWILNLSDGSSSVLDIAERSGLSFDAFVARLSPSWIAVYWKNVKRTGAA
jgi:hypothetical protein